MVGELRPARKRRNDEPRAGEPVSSASCDGCGPVGDSDVASGSAADDVVAAAVADGGAAVVAVAVGGDRPPPGQPGLVMTLKHSWRSTGLGR